VFVVVVVVVVVVSVAAVIVVFVVFVVILEVVVVEAVVVAVIIIAVLVSSQPSPITTTTMTLESNHLADYLSIQFYDQVSCHLLPVNTLVTSEHLNAH